MSWLGLQRSPAATVIVRSDPVFIMDTLEIILEFLSNPSDVFHFAAVCFEWQQVVLSSLHSRSHNYKNVVSKGGVMTTIKRKKWGDLVKIFPNISFRNIDLSNSQCSELFNGHITSLSFHGSNFKIPSISTSSLTSLSVQDLPKFGRSQA